MAPRRAKAKGKAPRAAPLPFHNIITPEMAERHAVRLKARMDARAAEQRANYQTEYNSIAGHASRAGANAQQATAAARHHFALIHGASHLPK
jgi:hypothetical protein